MELIDATTIATILSLLGGIIAFFIFSGKKIIVVILAQFTRNNKMIADIISENREATKLNAENLAKNTEQFGILSKYLKEFVEHQEASDKAHQAKINEIMEVVSDNTKSNREIIVTALSNKSDSDKRTRKLMDEHVRTTKKDLSIAIKESEVNIIRSITTQMRNNGK